MTAKLFTEGEVETDEFLIVTEKQLALDSHHLEPTGRSSELLLLTLRKWEENHELRESEMIKNVCQPIGTQPVCVFVFRQASRARAASRPVTMETTRKTTRRTNGDGEQLTAESGKQTGFSCSLCHR